MLHDFRPANGQAPLAGWPSLPLGASSAYAALDLVPGVEDLQPRARSRAGTPSEAVQDADVLLLAVYWSRIDDVLDRACDVSGKVIVSCSLPMNASNTQLVVGHASSGAEQLARRIPKARVVSAFRMVPSDVLFNVF